jgi:hypothetical protein
VIRHVFQYDYILLTSSAALTTFDAQNLSVLLSAKPVILAKQNRSRQEDIIRLEQSFRQLNVDISGVVLIV